MKKNFKKKIIAIVFIVIALIAVAVICKTVAEMKVPEVSVEGGTTYLKFPFEKIAELPEEPDWENDPNAWEILEETRMQNEKINEFLQEEVKRSGASSFKYVNKNGDIMINEEISSDTKIYATQAFFKSKSNDLVIIELDVYVMDTTYISVYRHEYFKNTHYSIHGNRYVTKNNHINSSTSHDFYKNNNLFYYVKSNDRCDIMKIAKKEEICGFVETCEGDITYPIILRDNGLYVYIVENAIPNTYAYYVESDTVSIKEVNLLEVKGTCTFEEDYFFGFNLEGEFERGKYLVNISISEDFDTTQLTQSLSECCKKILDENGFIYDGESGYVCSYWEKD